MKRIGTMTLVFLLCLAPMASQAEGLLDLLSSLFSNHREYTIGTDIPFDSIQDFYWTYDASTFPPAFQRYRLYAEGKEHFFYHEIREGDHWPLMEEDVTVSGTVALTDAQWVAFCECLDAGTVHGREENTETGNSGPWCFLYWVGDQGKYQVFSFADWEKQAAFEVLCEQLTEETDMQTIHMFIGNQAFQVALADNETANAFRALLPMTLHMEELNGNEKYHYLMSDLPTASYNPGTISAGDLRLFGGSCVVLFYKTFQTGYNYTDIGKVIDSTGLADAVGAGDVDVTFEEIEP